MKGIIIYKSKYGATKKYAGWLADETGYRCVSVDNAAPEDLRDCDTVIFGGGIYASGISGLSFLKKNVSGLLGKKLIVFCVGASPYDAAAFQVIVDHNFKDFQEMPSVFYCRGAWDMEAMSFKDRTLCKMLRKMIAKKPASEYEPWMIALMAAGYDKCNWTDRSYLKSLLEAVK